MPRSATTSASPKRVTRRLSARLNPTAAAPSDPEPDDPPVSNEKPSEDSEQATADAPLAHDGPENEDGAPNQGSSIDHRGDEKKEPESDSDDAPEAVSIVAGKRQVKQKAQEIDKFAQATARARRLANRVRDSKLKQNSRARKTKIVTTERRVDGEESSASDPQDADDNDDASPSKPAPAPPANTKKYLDPSLFASASNILQESKKATLAREADQLKRLTTARRKKQKKAQNQDWKDLGNNTTVVHLSQTDHLNPSPRPVAATNFARNRLYTQPRRSAVRLPKATLAAKAEMGRRKQSAFETAHARRSLKPALIFTRAHE
ncbi:hypothetical protein PCANC_16011 [Puccinia coronata f. sp. avenae]|uniref:Uncharacterized protein n=1 Tax=Puccinia coronata f. sp. avenae TaxID=200324 RepID=A0A2N5VRU6_9BASI|nr:hypothetical protein PCANC_16011 [Puccinia coronata f. sp. avenae]